MMMWRSTGMPVRTRGLHVAADGVGVAAELGLAKDEHRDRDDDGGDDHRPGQDAVHAAEHLAGDLRRVEEVEARRPRRGSR